ncbi:FAD-binding protein [Clostridiales bacterium BX7]|uniref:FAD-binding protein n=2 Tax=Feifania hominis TaxID=2763660 RepID=A0A926DEN1_9FIRM|nr:FAD-binding protein [Feifania hominis]
MEHYDVAIVGLGPAGATLARLLDSRFRVIALDKKRENGGFRKACGGLLAGDAQKALAQFDLTLPKDVLVDPQIFAVKTIDLKTGLIRHYQRFYVNLDRDKFDRWLLGLLPSHIETHPGCVCTDVRRSGSRFILTYRENGRDVSVTADRVVGADGANSIVRRTFYPRRDIRSYLSIQQWFPESHGTPFYSCIFDPETSDCCSWSISKDSQFIFGGAFPKDRARERFERQKEKLAERFGFQFGEPLKTEACLVLRPKKPGDFCCGQDGLFLIGEAAGFISPSSLEGISSAIRSASALASVLNSGVPRENRAYRAKTRKLRAKLLLKVLKCPFMYQPVLRRLVMGSGLASIPIIASKKEGSA